MFSQSQKNGIEYLHSELLNHCDFLVHAFGTRLGGVSRDDYKSLNMSFLEGDEEFRVLQNWDKFASAFEIPMENFLVLNQVHGDNIFVIQPHGDYFSSREALNYDAIVTNRMNLAICIKTADCVPVFLVDRIKKIIGAVHAGWRGSSLGISAKVVRLMQNTYGSRPADILAAIGPSIGPCCYEIDAATADFFRRQKDAGLFLSPAKRKNRWMLDIVEVNRLQLLNCGISEANIEATRICTVCRQDMFFSHRGSGGITGRQINFMMIKGDTICKALLVNGISEGIH
jgi:YfiH family protein